MEFPWNKAAYQCDLPSTETIDSTRLFVYTISSVHEYRKVGYVKEYYLQRRGRANPQGA